MTQVEALEGSVAGKAPASAGSGEVTGGRAEGRPAPTPMPISRRMRNLLIVAGVVALVALLWWAPSVPTIVLGGAALAVVLAFPVRALSRVMPWNAAVLATILVLVGLAAAAVLLILPAFVGQLSGLAERVPELAESLERELDALLGILRSYGLQTGTLEGLISDIWGNLAGRVEQIVENLLSGVFGFVSSAFNVVALTFGICFVAVYLVIDAVKVKSVYLAAFPVRYRRDAGELWNDAGHSLSRYLGSLIVIAAFQGVLAGVALWILGVPYALLLGIWVAITSIIPYLGAYLGAVPAVALAFVQSPTTGILVLLVYFLIQQLESNFITPRVQGQALRLHPILVLLAVIAGAEIWGLPGAVFAVPVLAIARVLFDFFRARLTVETPPTERTRTTPTATHV